MITIFRNKFFRNVATVASGTAAAQAIAMAFSPVITRAYGPEAFGLQGLFASLLNLLLPLAIMGYPTAIVLPKRDKDAIGIVKLVLASSICLASLLYILLFLIGESLITRLNAQALGPLVFALPLALVFAAMSTSLNQWLIRNRAFGISARFQVITAFLLGATKAGLGNVVPTPATLVLTNVFGGLIGTLLTFGGWLKSRATRKMPSDVERGATLSQLVKEYRDFPLFRTPQHFINTASQSLPLITLAATFGPGAAGQYAIALSVLAVPATLVGSSVASVFYPRITAAVHNGENVRAMMVKATVAMALTGCVPYFVVVALGPGLFQFVFGDEWRVSGEFAQWLALWLFLQYVHRPAAAAVPALGLNKSLLIYEVISSAAKIISLTVGLTVYENVVAAIAMFSLSGVISYVCLILWLVQKSPSRKGAQVML